MRIYTAKFNNLQELHDKIGEAIDFLGRHKGQEGAPPDANQFVTDSGTGWANTLVLSADKDGGGSVFTIY